MVSLATYCRLPWLPSARPAFVGVGNTRDGDQFGSVFGLEAFEHLCGLVGAFAFNPQNSPVRDIALLFYSCGN